MGKIVSLVSAPYTGVALLFSWTYLMFYADSAGVQGAMPISLMSTSYMRSAVAFIITLCVLAFAPFNRTKVLTSSPAKIITGTSMSISTAIMVSASFTGSSLLSAIGAVATGIASGLLTMQWVVAYRRIGIKRCICSFPTLMAMSVGICLTLMYLPRFVVLATMVIMPIVSEFMFHWVRTDLLPEFETDQNPNNRLIDYLLLLLPVGILYLATGYLDFYSATSLHTYIFYVLSALVPLVLAIVFAFVVDKKSIIQTAFIPLAFLVTACVPIVALYDYIPSAQFITIGELGAEVVIFTGVVAFSDFFSLNACKALSLARLCTVAFSVIGWNIADAVDASFSYIAFSQLSLMVMFIGVEALTVCLIVSVVKAQKDVKKEEGNLSAPSPGESFAEPKTASPAMPGPANYPNAAAEATILSTTEKSSVDAASEENQEARFVQCCQQIATEHDLSRREMDVFELLSRGFSGARIQQELFIAQGTVNYHTRNIYAKLGVHSKQEVIDLVSKRLKGRS